jgi:hypothetical protein
MGASSALFLLLPLEIGFLAHLVACALPPRGQTLVVEWSEVGNLVPRIRQLVGLGPRFSAVFVAVPGIGVRPIDAVADVGIDPGRAQIAVLETTSCTMP